VAGLSLRQHTHPVLFGLIGHSQLFLTGAVT
jgi:hypothetical protein